jgi:hypothetical protein
MDAPNAADRKSIRRQEKVARLAERARAEVITSIMSTLHGRAWLWDHLSSAHCFATTHVAGDPLGSAFQEGRRSLGLELLSDIMRACPDQYITAMREANERYNGNDRSPDPSSPSADPASERRSSPLVDGGDFGAEPDSSEADDAPSYASPGRDVYA